MRAFIAIELTEKLRRSLSGIQEQLKETNADVKWVEPQNIHLTLKFLGEINESNVAGIITAIENTVENNPQFLINISGIGAFPRIDSPRIIWAGLNKGDEEIKAIAGQIEEKLVALGINKEEREFSSHITIGRVRSQKNIKNLIEKLRGVELPQENLGAVITKITFFRSVLSSSGPTYEALKEINLKTN